MDATTLADRGTALVALSPLAATMDGGSIGEGITTNPIEFLGREVAPLAHCKALQPQRAHLHAAQLLHRMPQCEQHAADLAIAALEELHVEDRLLAIARDHIEPTGLGLAARASLTITEEDPALEPSEVIIGELARDSHLVALVHLVARVREPVGELTVIGHEEQPR